MALCKHFVLQYSVRKRWRVKSHFLNFYFWQPSGAGLPPVNCVPVRRPYPITDQKIVVWKSKTDFVAGGTQYQSYTCAWSLASQMCSHPTANLPIVPRVWLAPSDSSSHSLEMQTQLGWSDVHPQQFLQVPSQPRCWSFMRPVIF